MRSEGWKGFWMSFFLTALLLLPMVGGTLLLERHFAWQRARHAAESQSGVPVRVPTVEDHLEILVCIADDPADFVLVTLDANENRVAVVSIPGESAVPFGTGESTLRRCYAAAGPARCVQGLEAALGVRIGHYLALTPATLQKWAEPFEPLRVGLTGVLTAEELAACGQSGAVQDWTAAEARRFLRGWTAESGPLADPVRCGAVRAALWDAFFRQRLERLPAALPERLRKSSASLLTDLTAVDLYTLEETLEFLADDSAPVESGVLPGEWDAETGVYRLGEAAQTVIQALCSASAAGAQSAAGSAPYPSTSVPGGQSAGSE